MQITINTDTDDLPAVIRMLQAYAPPRKLRIMNDKEETLAEVAVRTVKITNDPIELTDEERRELTAAAIEDDGLHCTGHVDYAPETRVEAPTPEQVFAAPKSLFDSYVPGDNITVREAREAIQPPPSDVTVDAAGLPWDARIHSGAKTKLANGNWKLLRGVDPALVASVEAELRGAPKPATPTTPAAARVAEPASVPPPPAPVAPPVTAPSPPAPTPIPPAPKPITNAAELVAAVMDKRFTTDQVNAACQAVGIDNVASLLAKQDKLPAVLKELGV